MWGDERMARGRAAGATQLCSIPSGAFGPNHASTDPFDRHSE
jgi:hypothetical protein